MGRFHLLIHSLLLATSPTLLAYPQCDLQPIVQTTYTQEKPYDNFSLTYDEILRLLRQIESEKIQGHSKEKLNRISHFITFLAQQGKLPGDYATNAILESDIAELLDYDDDDFCNYAFASNFCSGFMFTPTLLSSDDGAEAYLCKSKKKHKKKFYKKMKDFVKKHRKTILIRENYFGQHQDLSLEENGRTLGSLFAHESFRSLQYQIPLQPALAQEVQTLNTSTSLAAGTPFSFCHPEIDRRFSTEYTAYYANNSIVLCD